MFSPSRPFFRASAIAAAAALLLVASARAQTSNINRDGFEMMRANLGAELSGGSQGAYSSYDYNYYTYAPAPIYWSLNGPRSTPLSWFRDPDLALPVPPPPPALGDDLPYARYPGGSLFPASEVSREIFYGPYAALVFRALASPKQTDRVTAYRRTRAELVHEIDAKCDQLRGAMPADRAAALAELARQQEPRVQALESEAEAIRSDIADIDVGYQLLTVHRGAGLSYQRAIQQAAEQFRAMYQYPGLSIEQRLLMPELAYEAKTRVGNNLLLLPAGAWIRLPDNIAPELEAKIAQFVTEKERLKTDLRDAVRREYYYFSFHREQRLSAIAAEQAPRFAALEALAEEIRLGLAQTGAANSNEPAALPADLSRRVAEFATRKQELQREVASRLRRVRIEQPDTHFQIALKEDTLAILPTGGAKKTPADLVDFNAKLTERYVTLARDTETLKHDIALFTESHRGQVAGGVDAVATEFLKAYTAREKSNGYREYYRAVLEPGLSPAQRRLLFQAAVEDLDQAGWLPRR